MSRPALSSLPARALFSSYSLPRTVALSRPRRKEHPMPTYMTQFSYTHDAIIRLSKNPEDRSVPVIRIPVNQL